MLVTGNTILVTGGASGIGLALVERFIGAGNHLIVCGRRESKLAELKAKYPSIETRVCDIAEPREREDLVTWVTGTFPALNGLVNNAGIQRRVRIADERDWEATRQEIAINFEAPLHLTMMLLPRLMAQPRAVVMNVTSGLSFVPLAATPVYCTTKAALHSFTLSLRHQLAGSSVEVIEVIPPAVDTDLGGAGLHTFGVNVDEFADAAMKQIGEGSQEVSYGFAQQASLASREELGMMFERMNRQAR
jgi:uncharacterized oxidoreductase